MRTIKYLAVHCTAGLQTQTIADLERIFKQRGFRRPGYHYVITPEGKVHQLQDESLISNGVKGFNLETINIAYIGGCDLRQGKLIGVDNRTPEQKTALRILLKKLKAKYPNATIQGHRDFSPDLNGNGTIEPNEFIKLCPCFNAKDEYKDL